MYPSVSSTEPNFAPLLKFLVLKNINCMPLLLLTIWNTTEIWWQLVISIFNSWEMFCMAVLPAGVGFNMLSSLLWKAHQDHIRCRHLYMWMDQDLRSVIRLLGSYEVQMVSSPSRQMFSTVDLCSFPIILLYWQF